MKLLHTSDWHVGKTLKGRSRLDEQKAVREEITLMRVWLDSAWRLRSDQKYDETRVVLDRVQAQGDMIRQKIVASKVTADATRKEEEVRKVREKIARTKQAIQDATLQKAALEAKVK